MKNLSVPITEFDQALKEQYPSGDLYGIAADFGVTVGQIRSRASQLKIKRPYTRREAHPGLNAAIQVRYPVEGGASLAKEFRVSEEMIQSRAKRRGIRSLNHRQHVAVSFIRKPNPTERNNMYASVGLAI